ncbi:hypothetical protein V7S43_015999 [Phytophthora oleae]|uniref:Integrase catalytic domain-containing protein n=1 Tax=Phytophthora oleae TaxID=2107226 RepID=A0ABD3EX51_9STRA
MASVQELGYLFFSTTSRRTGIRVRIVGSCTDDPCSPLKNHTNNRLESFFGKLKDGVDGSMSMAACVKALLAYDRRKQREYEYRLSRIGQFVNTNYDKRSPMYCGLRLTS